ncbi:hypothetical protein C8R47DRAFT_1140874 [Mycena vitilis]|nr:hypothetical protein C8R47DRAFT_1140874 [Mycena vitilis]
MFPARFVSVVVVALSALTVHGLATTGTPTGGVATKDTAVAGSIEACSGDNYENCVVVQFHEDTYTALPYNNVSSVKIPNNWLCTFTDGGLNGTAHWTVIFNDLAKMSYVYFDKKAQSFFCNAFEFK